MFRSFSCSNSCVDLKNFPIDLNVTLFLFLKIGNATDPVLYLHVYAVSLTDGNLKFYSDPQFLKFKMSV